MKKIIFVFVFIISFSAVSYGQSAVAGAVGGAVTDPSNAVVPNATVTLINIGTNREETITTGGDGRFKFDNLQPGLYTLTVKVPGFAEYKQEQITVEVGRTGTVNAGLKLGTATAEVSVVADIPLVNADSQEFASNINQTAINELPINGRRWSNFVMLTPGVVPDGSFGLLSFRGISGLLNNNTVDGGDNNQAFFGEERGRTRISYSVSQAAIQEFQVNTSNYSAEYGRAAGGVTNAITKSGTNDFHGDVFYFQRNSKWAARNPLAFQTINVNGVTERVGIKPDDVRHQFGGTLGGPVQKDKLFFFFSYDQQRRNFPGAAIFSSATYLDTVNRSLLTAAERNLTNGQINDALAFLSSLTGQVERRGDQLLLLPKLDWHLNNKNTLSVNYNRLRWKSPAGVQTTPTVTRGKASFGDDFVKVDWGNARLVSTISSKAVNEFRFQYARDFEYQLGQAPAAGEPQTAVNGSAPDVNLTSGFNFGRPNFLDRTKYPQEKRSQFTDNMTLALGSGTLKFGADFNHVDDVLSNLFTESGSYLYGNINDFIVDYVNWKTPVPTATCATTARLAGRCYTGNYQQGFGTAATQFSTTDYNFYVQYDWKAARGVSVNMGLRYEYQQLPDALNPNPSTDQIPNTSLTLNEATSRLPSDKTNWGPRVGVALDLTGDGRTSLRGGYGLYYGRVINSTIYNALINTGATGGTTQAVASLAPTAATSPVFPNTLASAPLGSGQIQFFSSDFKHPMIHQTDLAFERQITRGTTVSASYLLSLGRKLPGFYDRNLNAPTGSQTYTFTGGPFDGQTDTVPAFRGTRPNTNFSSMTELVSKIRSTYNAMVLQLNRQMTGGLQFQINYTLSKATDTLQTSQTFTTSNTPFNVFDPDADRGRSNVDRRHKVVANLIYSPRVTSGNRTIRAIADGWTIAPIYQYYTGLPVDALVSGSLPSATPTNPAIPNATTSGYNGSGGRNRLFLIPRNNYTGPNIWNVDLRLSRRFYIGEKMNAEALVEGFNIFNRTEVTALNSTIYAISGTAQNAVLTYQSSFLTPSEAGTNFLTRERQLQVGFRFHF